MKFNRLAVILMNSRTLLLAAGIAAGLTAIAPPARAQVASLYFREVAKDGNIYIFNSNEQYKKFGENGDMGKAPISLPAYGPAGELVIAENETAVDLYNLKHDKEAYDRPAPKIEQPKSVTWKPAGLSIKLSNFELKMGFRAQFQLINDRNEYCGNCTNVLGVRSTTNAATGITTVANINQAAVLSGNQTTGDSYSTTSFSVRRVKPFFQGWAFDPRFKYDIQFETTQGGSGTNLGLAEALVDIEFNPAAVLRIGQWKGPYGRQRFTSDGRGQFVEPSLVSSAFAMGFEDGVMLFGNLGGEKHDRFEYNAGIFNGNGKNPNSTGGNPDNKPLYALRAVYTPFGKYDYAETAVDNPQNFLMYVGGSWNTNSNRSGVGTTAIAETQIDKWGLEVGLKWHILSFNGEYFSVKTTADTDNYSGLYNLTTGVSPTLVSRAHAEQNARGWYAQAGVFAIPSTLEFAVRLASMNPNRDVDHQKTEEFRFGVNYYLSQSHFHKLQLDWGTVKRQYNGSYVNTPTTAPSAPPALCTVNGTTGYSCDDHEIKESQIRLQYQFWF